MACKRQLATSTAEGHEGAPLVEEPVQTSAGSSPSRSLKRSGEIRMRMFPLWAT
jgi:hypothetical protein